MPPTASGSTICMGARCADLRNYLIAVGYYPADSEVVIPGTSETRVFRLT